MWYHYAMGKKCLMSRNWPVVCFNGLQELQWEIHSDFSQLETVKPRSLNSVLQDLQVWKMQSLVWQAINNWGCAFIVKASFLDQKIQNCFQLYQLFKSVFKTGSKLKDDGLVMSNRALTTSFTVHFTLSIPYFPPNLG